jgi:hypothetical protein
MSVITRTGFKPGLDASGAVAVTGCSLLQPQQAPVVAPAVAPAPAAAGQAAPGQAFSGDSSRSAAALGQRGADGGHWPLSVQVAQNGNPGPVVVDGRGFRRSAR